MFDSTESKQFYQTYNKDSWVIVVRKKNVDVIMRQDNVIHDSTRSLTDYCHPRLNRAVENPFTLNMISSQPSPSPSSFF